MNKPDVANIFSLTTKRVTDIVLEQSREAFRQAGVELDARMISIITLIRQSGPHTSTFLAETTGLSRQLVESRLRRLVADGYLEEQKLPDDLRKRVYSIATPKLADVDRAISTVGEFERAYEDLWKEIGVDVQQGLRKVEVALVARPLVARLGP